MEVKGIINIEIIITMMILLTLFLMLISFSSESFTILEETQNRHESRLLAEDIENIISQTYLTGDGYSKNYTLPEKIYQETYVVKINQTGVYINSHYQLATEKHHIKNIYDKETYLTPSKTYEFKNNNNTVIITEINL